MCKQKMTGERDDVTYENNRVNLLDRDYRHRKNRHRLFWMREQEEQEIREGEALCIVYNDGTNLGVITLNASSCVDLRRIDVYK